MYWLIEVYFVIGELKQKITICLNLWLYATKVEEEINIPTITNKSTSEVALSVFLNKSKLNKSLL